MKNIKKIKADLENLQPESDEYKFENVVLHNFKQIKSVVETFLNNSDMLDIDKYVQNIEQSINYIKNWNINDRRT